GFLHRSRFGNAGRRRRLITRFRVGPRRVVFGIRQAASTARAAATALPTATARAPASPVAAALIATAVRTTVLAPISLESGRALHGARRRRQRGGRRHIHGLRHGIRRGSGLRFWNGLDGYRLHQRVGRPVQLQDLFLHRGDDLVVLVVVLEE